MNRCLAALLALMFASLSLSSACAAAPSTDQPSRLVSYADLDLSSQAGVATLHRRISVAINELCADPTGPSPAVTVDVLCKREAWAAVRGKLENAVAAARRDDGKLALVIAIPVPAPR